MTGLGTAALERLRALNQRERGLPLIFSIDLALFGVLIILYLVVRGRTPVWPRPFHFPTGIMTIAMIMFAGSASFVTHVARKSRMQGDAAMVQRMLALSLVGWSTFLFLLAMEWARLYLIERVTLFSNPWHVGVFGFIYYGLTAYQGTHVAFGSLWLSRAAQEPLKWSLTSIALFVDLTNLFFILIAFFFILSSTDLNGF